MGRWLNLRILFWVFAVIISVALFYGIFSSPAGIKGYLNKKSQLVVLNENIENIARENERLYENIKQFRSNPKCRMRIIREELGWIQEGERRITFVPGNQGKTP